MRVLITGHKGYIGSVMTPYLKAAGHDVVGLDNEFFGECVFGRDGDTTPPIRKDLRDVTIEDLRGFEAVVHLAALANDPLGDLNPRWTFEINHERRVALAADRARGGHLDGLRAGAGRSCCRRSQPGLQRWR